MLPAARITDAHTCLMQIPAPHVGGTIVSGSPTVMIGFMPAARVTDMCVCACPAPPNPIVMGSSTVLIGFLPAARISSGTVHGGTVVSGAPTVIIGG